MTALELLAVILAVCILVPFSVAMFAALNHVIETDTTPRIKRKP